ncbi:MAG TPA: DUF3800 domain-containing protein [Verrucomicrobiae bacterium]
MSVRLIYIDESYDASKFCLSAIVIRHSEWNTCFELVLEHRRKLKRDYGIFLRKEIHATEFVAGRGKISDRLIGKWERSRIFLGLLELTASLPKVLCFNVCLDSTNHEDPQMAAWDRLLNRIERTLLEFERREIPERRTLTDEAVIGMQTERAESLRIRLNDYSARGLIVADEGREHDITKALRKMKVYNPIPSQFGAWPNGQTTQNITTRRILEDPVFKPSFQSYFIQLADCIAFSLLKREVAPTSNIQKYRINKMFDDTVTGICYKPASPKDPLGIVRA